MTGQSTGGAGPPGLGGRGTAAPVAPGRWSRSWPSRG